MSPASHGHEFSVIIPCRNGADYLPFQLQALSLEEPGVSWELIIVDNGSTDASADIAIAYADRLPLHVVKADREASQAYALNVGTELSRSENLLFLDADDEIAPGYLRAMNRALGTHPFVMSHKDGETMNPPWTETAHAVPASTHDGGRFLPFAGGGSIGITRSLLNSIGGVPEGFGPLQDQALSFEVQLAGVGLYSVPDAVVRYRYRHSLTSLFRQTREWGRYQTLVFASYRARGMPRRPLITTVSAWIGLLPSLRKCLSRGGRGQTAVRFGYCLGRLEGSIRYRVWYL